MEALIFILGIMEARASWDRPLPDLKILRNLRMSLKIPSNRI
jgi:hypothetical protein